MLHPLRVPLLPPGFLLDLMFPFFFERTCVCCVVVFWRMPLPSLAMIKPERPVNDLTRVKPFALGRLDW